MALFRLLLAAANLAAAAAFAPGLRSLARPLARPTTVRGPTSEPMVPWKIPNTQYYQFVPIGQRFYRERIIILTDFMDEARSNNLIATLLYLKQQDSTKQITLYFNVPGALMKPSLAVYDTIKSLKCPVMTLNLGLATGMAAFLCAAGTPGKRFALPNSRFLLQKTGLDDPFRGQAVDIGLRVSDNISDNKRFAKALAEMTGQTVEKVTEDLGRDFYLSSFEAVEYGLIDRVLVPKKNTEAWTKETPNLGSFGEVQGSGFGVEQPGQFDDYGEPTNENYAGSGPSLDA